VVRLGLGLGLALGLQLKIGIGFRRNHSWSSIFTPGVTIASAYFKHILPAGVVAQWLAAWTAGCTIPVRIPSRLKYSVLFIFNFFELILRSGEIGR